MDFMKGIACHISKSSWDLQYLETGGTGGGGGGTAALPPPPPPPYPSRFLLASIFDELRKIVLKWKIAQNYKTSWNSSKFIDVYSIIDLGTRDESCQ